MKSITPETSDDCFERARKIIARSGLHDCGYNLSGMAEPIEYYRKVDLRSGEVVSRHFEMFISLFVGEKWSDIGPLEGYRPEGEKYITRKSLLSAIKALPNKKKI